MSKARAFSKDDQLGNDPTQDAAAFEESERDRFNHPPRGWPAGPLFCDECDSRPCADYCTTQQTPDTLHMKASRAGLTPLQYATERADVLARYPDSPAARDAAALVAQEPQDDGRHIYGPQALATALRVVAGERTVEEALRERA